VCTGSHSCPCACPCVFRCARRKDDRPPHLVKRSAPLPPQTEPAPPDVPECDPGQSEQPAPAAASLCLPAYVAGSFILASEVQLLHLYEPSPWNRGTQISNQMCEQSLSHQPHGHPPVSSLEEIREQQFRSPRTRAKEHLKTFESRYGLLNLAFNSMIWP